MNKLKLIDFVINNYKNGKPFKNLKVKKKLNKDLIDLFSTKTCTRSKMNLKNKKSLTLIISTELIRKML